MNTPASSSWLRTVATWMLAILLLVVVAFFGLTRTEVGRDGLRAQIENQFNNQFEGTLHIDRLDGNFIHALFATNVQVRSPQGQVVVQADSMVLRPSWRSLLNRTIDLHTAEAHGVQMVAQRTGDGWPLAHAFRTGAPDPEAEPDRTPSDTVRVARDPTLQVSLPRIRLVDTHVVTHHDGPAPDAIANGWITDVLNTTVDIPEADLLLEWDRGGPRAAFDIHRLHQPDTDLTVQHVHGHLAQTDVGWHLHDLSVATDATRLSLTGQWDGTRTEQAALALQATAEPFDFGEWEAFFPRITHTDAVTLDLNVSGPLDALDLHTLQINQQETTFRATGALYDLAHTPTLEATVDLQNLTAAVASAWSDAPLPAALNAALPLSGTATLNGSGQISNRAVTQAVGSVDLDVDADVGGLQTTADLTWAHDAPLEYEARVRPNALSLHELVPDVPGPTLITGLIDINGTGLSYDTATAQADVALINSLLAGGEVTRTHTSLALDQGTLRGNAALTQRPDHTLEADLTLHPSTADGSRTLQAHLHTTDFDVSPWGGPWQATALSTELSLHATTTATTIESATLTADIDPSTLTPASSDVVPDPEPRSVPGHTITATLTDANALGPPNMPRLIIGGDVIHLAAGGSGWNQPSVALLDDWAQALTETIAYEHEATGSMETDTSTTSAEPPTWSSLGRPDSPFTLWTEATLLRSEVLHAWVPTVPETADDATARADVYADADSVHAHLHLRTNTLERGALSADTLNVRAGIGADAHGSLPERLRLTTETTAHRLQTPAATLFEPTVNLQYAARMGTLALTTGQRGQTGPIRVEADLRAFDDRNEIIMHHVEARAGEHTWRTAASSRWSVYADRIEGTPLRLTSEAPLAENGPAQSIVLAGAFSDADDDTLQLQFDNVQLLPLSQLAGWNQPLGGLINGDIDIEGSWQTPVTTGSLNITEWSFDRRLLGNLSVSADYTAGAPDLNLDLSLVPTPDVDAPREAAEALVPDGIQQVVSNTLDLTGRLRVASETTEWEDDEWLDLNLDVERADLFFFDFVFGDVLENIEGYTAGTSAITGRWGHPVFDADMEVDGRFTIPRFNLDYAIAGPIAVDEEGIHLNNARLDDGDEGEASIAGSVLFNDYQFFSFDLESEVNELTIMDVQRARDLPFYGFIRASGPLSLTGPLSNTTLRSNDARTTSDSEVFIPITEADGADTSGFLIYADSTSQLLDWQQLTRRANIFADRPEGEASFLDGMEIDLNIGVTQGGRLHIVFDALVGDVITTESTGRVQLQREDGIFSLFGSLDVIGGDYLFTAGEVFVRRFNINRGTLFWDGDPINAELDIEADYRTRASPAGLPGFDERSARIPVIIDLDITGRVETPEVALGLSLDRDQRDQRVGTDTFDALLNQEDLMTEFATSVLLTNTFLLTTENIAGTGSRSGEGGRLTDTGGQLAFNSVSQLVSSQLNRYLSEALPNVDINVGVQGETTDDLDIIYGVALRLMDERLIIRGEGVYTGNDGVRAQQSGPQGEFAVEVRLSNQVSMEVFYRRTGDDLTRGQTLTSTTGVGLSYQTQFDTWGTLWRRVIDGSNGDADEEETNDEPPPTLDPPVTETDTSIDTQPPRR